MCGIVAQFSKKTTINAKEFDKALKTLTHRGPDEYDHTLLRDHKLAFGHTRLSIIGVNNGRQPHSNYDNTIYSIVNGEFYDYKEIRQECMVQGYTFKTETDSEIIIPLYQKYGYDAFKYLNGEFAGIIYDKPNNSLVIFRDRHGVKPLFIKNTPDNLILASEIKTILEIDKSQPEWNVDYLKQCFNHMNTFDETVFKDIYHVKPGHYIVFNLNTYDIAEHKYWQIDFAKHNYLNESIEDLARLYEKQFTGAVSKRLVADVGVATYLSGGIDSSACYGIASHLKGHGVDAFTISFDNPDYDEFKLAQKMVKKYGGHHHVLQATEKLLVDNYENHMWYMEGISNNPHSVAKYLLSKTVRDSGFKVVITGEGADEYNAGYAPSVMDALKYTHASSAKLSPGLLKISSGAMFNSDAKELDYAIKMLGFSPSWFESSASENKKFNELFAANYQEQNPDINMQRWLQKRVKNDFKNWDILNTSLYLTGQCTFAYVLTVLGDRTEMAHSVEARVPFLDHNLLDFLAKVPPKYKANADMDKLLLRMAMKKYVTEEHFNTPKHPYLAPPLVSEGSLFARYLHDVFSSSSFANSGLFDVKKILDMLKTLTSSNKALPEIEKRLFKALSFAVLHKTFNFKDL